MTQILETAWNKLIVLPEEKQECIAQIILDEIQDENFWDSQFIESKDTLISIKESVKSKIKEGKFQNKGFGAL